MDDGGLPALRRPTGCPVYNTWLHFRSNLSFHKTGESCYKKPLGKIPCLPCWGLNVITPARIRAIRAYLGESQIEFAARFATSRYTVIHWEKYGLVDSPKVEGLMLKLERPSDERSASSAPPSTPE